jgi:hypothetical protein
MCIPMSIRRRSLLNSYKKHDGNTNHLTEMRLVPTVAFALGCCASIPTAYAWGPAGTFTVDIINRHLTLSPRTRNSSHNRANISPPNRPTNPMRHHRLFFHQSLPSGRNMSHSTHSNLGRPIQIQHDLVRPAALHRRSRRPPPFLLRVPRKQRLGWYEAR